MRPVSITWPAPSTTSICALQNTAGAANLVLNGPLTTGYPTPSVTFPNYSRTVSFTSLNDLSGDNFTITGTYLGNTQSEVLAGPNNDTVYSTKLYDSITSISVNAAVNGISVGTGTTGQTKWLLHNFHATIGQIGIGVTATATINYSYQVTLEDISKVTSPKIFTPITALTGATTSQFYTGELVAYYSNIIINSSNGTGALTVDFIQQGLVG